MLSSIEKKKKDYLLGRDKCLDFLNTARKERGVISDFRRGTPLPYLY